MSSDFKLELFGTKIILMSSVNFWSITTGYDVKYLLPVGIDKFNKDKKTFAFAVIVIKQLLTKQFSIYIKE